MYGDRNDTGSSAVNFSGGTVEKIDGVVYFPSAGMNMSGSTSSNGNYLSVVVDHLNISGSAAVSIPTPNYNQLPNSFPLKAGVSLAE
jgi:hypothetical protein